MDITKALAILAALTALVCWAFADEIDYWTDPVKQHQKEVRELGDRR